MLPSNIKEGSYIQNGHEICLSCLLNSSEIYADQFLFVDWTNAISTWDSMPESPWNQVDTLSVTPCVLLCMLQGSQCSYI